MNVEHEIDRYFSLAKDLGRNPSELECLLSFQRIWQGGRICKEHDHKFKRMHLNVCVDCRIFEIHAYAALLQLRKDLRIHTVYKNGKRFWVAGKNPTSPKKCKEQWSSGMMRVLDDCMKKNMTASAIADRMNNDFIFMRTVTRNAVIGKIFRMRKKEIK